ncbi:ribonuclease H-like domain-containing protein [Tanacetum coccineum]
MSVHNYVDNYAHNSDDGNDYVEDPVTLMSRLDISDHLHLHPNDSFALTVVSIKLKGTENYQVWSCVMLLSLEGKNKTGFIDGSCKRSNTNEESHRVASGSIDGPSNRNQAYVFVSNVPNKNNFQRSNQNFNNGPRPNNLKNIRQGGGFTLVYENCGFNGHSIDRFHLLEANQHMTYTDKELDNMLDISHLKIKVGHPNGTEAFISKIRNLKLSNGLILYDVLVIPKYCVTLISVNKLVKENNIIVAFDKSRCYFLNQDLNLRNVLGIGNQCEGLYYYNNQGIKSNLSVSRYQCYLSQHDWHCRLGHPIEPVLNVLKDSLQFDNKDQTICCEICQMAK